MAAEEGTPPAEAVLAGMKLSALKKRAKEVGVEEEKLEEADDADDIKAAVIALILEAARGAEAAQMREELAGMKLSALKKRAKQAGVDEEKLEEADDADDIKAAVIDLILAQSDGAAVEASHDAALRQLREELGAMKLSRLKKRAREVDVGEGQLEEADDAEDIKAAVIELIVGRAREDISSASKPAASIMPHHGGSTCTSGTIDEMITLFGTKHAILSYQWDVQEEVKMVKNLMKAKGVPTWMDIDGGMETDIYDSMAKGIQNAAVCIPFMTEKYHDSENCQLELKFAKQTGVPIVPVMMQKGFHPSGWLGLLTAGTLWTPMYDQASCDENVDALVRQIKLALGSMSEESAWDAREIAQLEPALEFSVTELRDELDRLKSTHESQNVATTTTADDGNGLARVPAAVPELPPGMLVTGSMEELLHELTVSATNRIGFWGMGGIGKTTISAWIVRQHSVRQMFEQIIWVSVGQTPTIVSLQSLALQQLTGSVFTGDEPEEQRKQTLQQAMAGKKILLVLDDCWDSEHEKLLSFVDVDSGAKVLLSSRVRQVFESGGSMQEHTTAVVTIALPTEEDAVNMLLSTAGLTAALPSDVSAEALKLVRFCKLLPLSISIAGKLVQDFDVGGLAAEAWQDILTSMREEFAEHDGARSVEESVIAASVNSIRGSQKQTVMHLFRCFALVPEDTIVPLEVLVMMYEAVPKACGGHVKRPSVLNTRRWLKQLVDRSLVLGTVDRPSLHDLVRDFVVSELSQDELRQSHRRLVDLLRAARPLDAATEQREWNNAGNVPLSRYVQDFCGEHICHGWNQDWERDEHAIAHWLGDFPCDDIVCAAGSFLGLEKLNILGAKAEGRDKWEYAKLAATASMCARRDAGIEAGLEWERRAMDALGALDDTTERSDDNDRLELEVGVRLLGGFNRADLEKYIPRLLEVSERPVANKHPFNKLMALFMPPAGRLVSGEMGPSGHDFAEDWLYFEETVANGASTHPDEAIRIFLQQLVTCGAPWEACVRHKERFNYDRLYGEDGELLRKAIKSYDYDVHHKRIIAACVGCDCGISFGTASTQLAIHYGDLVSANWWMDRCMQFTERMLAEPNRALESFSVAASFAYWGVYSVLVGRQERYLAMLVKTQVNWNTADDFIDELVPHVAGFRPRGDKTMGVHFATAELYGWLLKLSWVMVSPDPGMTPQEFADALPSFEDIVTMTNAGLSHSYCNLLTSNLNVLALIADACEKLGLYEQGLHFAEQAATNSDIKHGGSFLPSMQFRGYRTMGRCLVATGELKQAEDAFEKALASIEGFEFFLLEVLCLRDLKVFLLDKDGRSDDGSARLKAAIFNLLGETRASEQLAELDLTLGKSIDLGAILA